MILQSFVLLSSRGKLNTFSIRLHETHRQQIRQDGDIMQETTSQKDIWTSNHVIL